MQRICLRFDTSPCTLGKWELQKRSAGGCCLRTDTPGYPEYSPHGNWQVPHGGAWRGAQGGTWSPSQWTLDQCGLQYVLCVPRIGAMHESYLTVLSLMKCVKSCEKTCNRKLHCFTHSACTSICREIDCFTLYTTLKMPCEGLVQNVKYECYLKVHSFTQTHENYTNVIIYLFDSSN